MKKHIIYSIVLVLAFLFFPGCGKKENNPPSSNSKNINIANADKKIQKKYPLKNKTVHKIKSVVPSVVITAKLTSEKSFNQKNILAKIIYDRHASKSLVMATSTNCKNKEITFPPIRKRLKRLRVTVKADNYTESYSDYFDATDGNAKTVTVELLQSVNFRGRVVKNNGEPLTHFKLKATPRGLYEGWEHPGHVFKKIITDNEGYFELSNLLPEHYTFKIMPTDAQYLKTNLVLYLDEDNYVEFVVRACKQRNVKGIVLFEDSNEPAEGIEIMCKNLSDEVIKSTTTDEGGKFNMDMVFGSRVSTVLKINKPGYAKMSYNVHNYSGETIKLFLRQAGILTGTIKTKSGEPVSDIKIILSAISEHKSSSKLSIAERKSQREYLRRYSTQSDPSDENGNYVISNAAARQTYKISTSRGWDCLYFPIYKSKWEIEIMPGETTVHDITMLKTPIVLVKLKDENNKPVVKYKLYVKSDCHGWGSRGWRNARISDENNWYKFYPSVNEAQGILTLSAKTGEGLVSETKEFSIEAGKTYNVNLKLGEPTQPPDIAGFIYTSDEQPYADGFVSATAIGKSGQSKCDHLGYFQITEMDVDKGAKVELYTSHNQIAYTTNIFGKDDNIEWTLPNPTYLCGRVLIEDYTTPATNFTLQIMEKNCTSKVISKDGYFSLPIKRYTFYKKGKKLEISIFVPEYAPVSRELEITNTQKYDFGDIVILNKPAAITGRVVDHNHNPIDAKVVLLQTKNKEGKYFLKVNSNPNNGTFEFNNLPPGNYFVKANAFSDYVESKSFDLNSDENYSLPDLVIQDTNALNILFSFVLPDGSPAANMEVNHFRRKTDEYGTIEAKKMPGTYRNWELTKDTELYYAEKVKIKKGDKNVKIKLIYCPNISGTVTLDGEILDNASLDFRIKNKTYYTKIYAGKFEIKALPGKHTIICRNKKITTTVELIEGNDNKINFTSGSGTFNFKFPMKQNWWLALFKKVDKNYVYFANKKTAKVDNYKMTDLPVGEYSISAQCRGSFTTSIFIKASLEKGETQNIKF